MCGVTSPAHEAAATCTPSKRRPSSSSPACLTMHLGEPPKRQVIPVGGIVHVTPGTPLQTVNEGAEDLVVYAYGAPPDEGAKVLPPAD